MPTKPLNPNTTLCVIKHNGTKVGEVPATAPNASDYMAELARAYGGLEVEFVENPDSDLVPLFHRPR